MQGTLDIAGEPLLWDVMNREHQKRRSADVHLDRVRAGGHIEIVELSGDDEQTRALEQLGVRQGANGRVRAKAPLGGPVLLEIAGSSIAIAKNIARKIRVKLV